LAVRNWWWEDFLMGNTGRGVSVHVFELFSIFFELNCPLRIRIVRFALFIVKWFWDYFLARNQLTHFLLINCFFNFLLLFGKGFIWLQWFFEITWDLNSSWMRIKLCYIPKIFTWFFKFTLSRRSFDCDGLSILFQIFLYFWVYFLSMLEF
jgi:hypothetical protein